MHSERLLTVREAAALTAMSPSYWRQLMGRGGIPVVKLGRASRLRERDVLRLIADGERPAQTTAEALTGASVMGGNAMTTCAHPGCSKPPRPRLHPTGSKPKYCEEHRIEGGKP